jgi:hypothetical protein
MILDIYIDMYIDTEILLHRNHSSLDWFERVAFRLSSLALHLSLFLSNLFRKKSRTIYNLN